MNNILTKIAIAVLILAFVYGAGAISGWQWYGKRMVDKQLSQLRKDAELVSDLEKITHAEKTKVEERVKIISQTVDDCINRRAPDSVLDGLRDPRTTTRPKVTQGVRATGAGG